MFQLIFVVCDFFYLTFLDKDFFLERVMCIYFFEKNILIHL